MADQWYYLSGGKQLGPIPLPRLRELIAAGILTETVEVWKQGTPDWLPARAIPQLRDLFPRRPEPQPLTASPPSEPGPAPAQPGVFVHRPPIVSRVIALSVFLVLAAGGVWLACWLANASGGVILPLGVVFALLILCGIAISSLWRIVFEIDGIGTVTVAQGPVWPLFESRYSAADFAAVAITFAVRYRKLGEIPRVTYFLELRGTKGPVRLAREHDSRAIRYLPKTSAGSSGST